MIGEFAASTEALLSKYLAEKANSIDFIEVLLTRYYKPRMNFIRVTRYAAGKLIASSDYGSRWSFLLHFGKTRRTFLHILCLMHIALCLFKLKPKFDICIACAGTHFALIGLALRRLGLVTEVFFISVFHPSPSKGFNIDAILDRFLRFSDRIAHNSCDVIWYQTLRMKDIKEREGFVKNENIPRILVPIGVLNDREDLSNNQVERTTVGYVGRLDEDMGLESALEAFSQVVKVVPNARLIIIGSGPSEEKLRQKVQTIGLGDNVDFRGFIGDRKKVEDILSKCAISIAPYIPSPDNPMQYADSAKAKEYMQYGTPIIITKVPEIAFEIEVRRAGFAVNYDKEKIAEAMIKLLTDDGLWQECRENVRQLAIKYDYRKIYDDAFQASGIKP